MLDIKLVKKNTEKVKKGLEAKKVDTTLVDKLIETYDDWTDKLEANDKLSQKKNEIAREGKYSEVGKKVKEDSIKSEQKVHEAKKEYDKIAYQLPNLPLDNVPKGPPENFRILKDKVGNFPKFDFSTKNHLELGESLDIIDTKTAAKVSGSRFAYLKNQAVNLEFALVQFAFEKLSKEGFNIMNILETTKVPRGGPKKKGGKRGRRV